MDTTNPYRSPESLDLLPASPRSAAVIRICSRVMLVVNLLLTLVVTSQILRWSDGFSRVFHDFDSVPPPLTRLVLSNWYGWILPALAVIGIAKEFLLKSRCASVIWNGAHLAVAIVIWRLYVVGVFGHFADLLKRLEG